ncbi:MAG: hypothetical protein NT170_03695 [Candidatus Moranbacteria bacterium]|nr:hypothetical protein [Candidatus Moranbacteria bacterium]
MLTNTDVKEFQKLYEKEFGTEISFEVAKRHARQLLDLLKAVYKPCEE